MRVIGVLFSFAILLIATLQAQAEEPKTWNGFYGGLQFGWASIDNDFTHLNGPMHPPFDIDADGILGGVLAGHNWRSNNFVFGLEGDISLADLDGKRSSNPDHVVDIDWLATLRGRAGVLVDENILVYATGGLAITDIKFQHVGHHKWTETYYGWTVGGGVEAVVMNGIRAGVEALYLDFGKENDKHPHAGANRGAHTVENDASGFVVRAKLVVPFNILNGG